MRENTRSCLYRLAAQFTKIPSSSAPVASGAGAAKPPLKNIAKNCRDGAKQAVDHEISSPFFVLQSFHYASFQISHSVSSTQMTQLTTWLLQVPV